MHGRPAHNSIHAWFSKHKNKRIIKLPGGLCIKDTKDVQVFKFFAYYFLQPRMKLFRLHWPVVHKPVRVTVLF